MPKLDKDEALRRVRKMLDKASAQRLTILKKEISNMNQAALNQFYEFLVREVVDDVE